MRILYGVVGEGMGHATRSRVMIQHLVDGGHEVEIMVSGRAHDVLARHFEGVHLIHGLRLVYEENTVKKTRTALENLVALGEGLPHNVAAYFELLDRFAPQIVISDFESWAWGYGKSHRLPVISIDNMQIINRCSHDEALIGPHDTAFRLTRAVVKTKLPRCWHYLVTTFFFPPLRKERTTLVPPILRDEVIAIDRAAVERGDHVLVYQSSDSHESLIDVLGGFPDTDFLVYGLRRGIESNVVEGNIIHRPFSETDFIHDLASARAVVAGGGFSLMSEAVYLGVPMLSVPLAGQFEQTLNGLYLERLGYGLHRADLGADDLAELLARADELRANLTGHVQDGNRMVFDHLDRLIADIEDGSDRPLI